jgi:hypothetical protein
MRTDVLVEIVVDFPRQSETVDTLGRRTDDGITSLHVDEMLLGLGCAEVEEIGVIDLPSHLLRLPLLLFLQRFLVGRLPREIVRFEALDRPVRVVAVEHVDRSSRKLEEEVGRFGIDADGSDDLLLDKDVTRMGELDVRIGDEPELDVTFDLGVEDEECVVCGEPLNGSGDNDTRSKGGWRLSRQHGNDLPIARNNKVSTTVAGGIGDLGLERLEREPLLDVSHLSQVVGKISQTELLEQVVRCIFRHDPDDTLGRMVIGGVLGIEIECVIGHLPSELVVIWVDSSSVERVGLVVDVTVAELELVQIVLDFEEGGGVGEDFE